MSRTVIEIVRVEAKDAAIVAGLFDAYRRFYGQASAVDAALAFITERLAGDESVMFLARETGDGPPTGAGFVQLYPSFTSVGLARTWILNDLFVDPEYRRRGVARRLMERAIEFGAETGRAAIALETATNNFSAKPLYESLGFIRDTEFDRYALPITPRSS